MNSSQIIFIPLEAVINLKDGEIVDDSHDIEDNVVPGPELGDVGVERALEAKDDLKDLCNFIKVEHGKDFRRATHSKLQWKFKFDLSVWKSLLRAWSENRVTNPAPVAAG